MIDWLTKIVLGYLIYFGIADKNDSDDIAVYRYGIEITISSCLNIILILIIGLLCGKIIESLIFLGIFILLRTFTGGFHASTYFWCNTMFCISFLIVLLLYSLSWEFMNLISVAVILGCSLATVFIYSPVENPNKPLGNKKRRLKITACALTSAVSALAAILIFIGNKYGTLMLYTILLVAALIIYAKFKEGRVYHEKSEISKSNSEDS